MSARRWTPTARCSGPQGLRIPAGVLRLAAACCVFACAGAPAAPPAAGVATPAAGRRALLEAVPQELLLVFDESDPSAVHRQAIERVGGALIRSYDGIPGLYHVSTNRGLKEIEAALGDDVLSVHPNRRIWPAAQGLAGSKRPNDPYFPLQWGLHNTGQIVNKIPGTLGIDVRAPQAWRMQTTATVLIAVLDSGVLADHQDLRANLWRNRGELQQPGHATNGVDDDGNGFIDDVEGWNFNLQAGQIGTGVVGNNNIHDSSGHGTEVTSILAAVGDNGLGMSGVAWSCQVMPLKIFKTDQFGTHGDVATAVAAIDYSIRMGARISSNSWGVQLQSRAELPQFHPLFLAIDRARQAGQLFVAAAGQDTSGNNKGYDLDSQPFLPAAYDDDDLDDDLDNVIAVTGVDARGLLPLDFNRGSKSVDLAAPATNLVSASMLGTAEYQYVAAGTSYAVPHVAGAAALFWSDRGPRSVDYAAVKGRILQTVQPLRSLGGITVSGGLLSVGRLLAPVPPVIPIEAGAENPK